MLKLSCKFGESKLNPCWLIMLSSSSSTNHFVNKHEDLDQYGSFAIPFEINTMLQLSCKFGESNWNPYWVIISTHWGRVTHICVSNLNIIGSDNGLSPGRRQAIIWTNAGILLIGPSGTNFSEILIEIHTFWIRKCILKCRLQNGVYFFSTSMC